MCHQLHQMTPGQFMMKLNAHTWGNSQEKGQFHMAEFQLKGNPHDFKFILVTSSKSADKTNKTFKERNLPVTPFKVLNN